MSQFIPDRYHRPYDRLLFTHHTYAYHIAYRQTDPPTLYRQHTICTLHNDACKITGSERVHTFIPTSILLKHQIALQCNSLSMRNSLSTVRKELIVAVDAPPEAS